MGNAELDVHALKNNLGHLVGRLSTGGKVQAYEQIAARLSELAGRTNGDAWSWRYVASVCSGSEKKPGKKFTRVLALLLEEIQPRAKQWFYFARYHSVASVFDKTMKREMITEHMLQLGYKPVNFTRWAELKRRATAAVRSGRA
jgi:hypothetical protein